MLAGAVCLQVAAAFLGAPAASWRAELRLRHVGDAVATQRTMVMQCGDMEGVAGRRAVLHGAHTALSAALISAISAVAGPTPALAAKGEWAKIDMTGKNSVSSMGIRCQCAPACKRPGLTRVAALCRTK